jgi:hypothetical protein
MIQTSKNKLLSKAYSIRDSKTLWSHINNVRNPATHNSTQIGGLMTPNELNKKFIENQLPSDEPTTTIVVDDTTLLNLQSVPILLNQREVQKLLSQVKNRATGDSGYHSWVLRVHCETLAPVVTTLFRKILNSSTVPDVYKRATISPIPKHGSNEFRPISLLPHLSKVLERLVLRHWLKPYVAINLCIDQFAFTSKIGLGTTNALTAINHAVLKYTDSSGSAARVLAVDFVKAFDRASTQHILSALQQLGVPLECYIWVRSFMQDRAQRVKLDNQFSDWMKVQSGVPQGSVLGPFLFAVLINSLTSLPQQRTVCVKYADDVTFIHHIGKGEADQSALLWQHTLNWARQHGLEINTKKTKIMTVCFCKVQPALDVLIGDDGSIVEEVNSMKLLGLLISSDTKWTDQVDSSRKRASHNLFLLRQLRHGGVPPHVLWNVHNALNRSLLTYAAPATVNMPDKLLKKLEHVEKRAAKIIGSEPSITLREFIHQICSRLMKDIIRQPLHPLRAFFTENSSSRKTRKKLTLLPPHAHTTRFNNSFIKFATLV